MSDPAVVELTRVTKRYTGHTAVKEFDLVVPRGSVYGLLGPNGAGKTTTIRMIMDIIVPDSGGIRLFGEAKRGRELSHRIGYLPEERGLYRKMKVLDLLVFLAQIKGVDGRVAKTTAGKWLDRLGLGDWAHKKIDDLSKGMQQKVQFISTLQHNPDLVILDEPFAGLDPVNTQVMKDVIVELRRLGTTTLFSTHIMEQAEKLCDSICIIARGEKVVDGHLSEVKRKHGGNHVIVNLDRGNDGADRLFADATLISKADSYGNYAELELADGADPQRLLQELIAAGASVTRFEVAEPTLNKIFIDLVGPQAASTAGKEAQENE